MTSRRSACVESVRPNSDLVPALGTGCLAEIENRGTEAVRMIVYDGLRGLPDAIEALRPKRSRKFDSEIKRDKASCLHGQRDLKA